MSPEMVKMDLDRARKTEESHRRKNLVRGKRRFLAFFTVDLYMPNALHDRGG
jgi:hypothetical protein